MEILCLTLLPHHLIPLPLSPASPDGAVPVGATSSWPAAPPALPPPAFCTRRRPQSPQRFPCSPEAGASAAFLCTRLSCRPAWSTGLFLRGRLCVLPSLDMSPVSTLSLCLQTLVSNHLTSLTLQTQCPDQTAVAGPAWSPSLSLSWAQLTADPACQAQLRPPISSRSSPDVPACFSLSPKPRNGPSTQSNLCVSRTRPQILKCSLRTQLVPRTP